MGITDILEVPGVRMTKEVNSTGMSCRDKGKQCDCKLADSETFNIIEKRTKEVAKIRENKDRKTRRTEEQETLSSKEEPEETL